MKRFGFIALLTTLLLLIASPAFATHNGAKAEVRYLQTFHNGGQREIATTGYFASECSTASCTVNVTLPAREYGRFLRWCRSDRVIVTVPVGDSWSSVDCPGEASLTIRVYGEIIFSTSLPAPDTHDAPVDVTVVVSKE